MIVTKRKKWYQKKFIAVFGGVKIQEIDGYYVFLPRKEIGTLHLNHARERCQKS